MNIDKAQIVAELLSRGLKDRAEWVDRELPDVVDTHTNGALLGMLNIDPAVMSPFEGASRPASGV